MTRVALTLCALLLPSTSLAQQLRQMSRTIHEGRSTPRPSNDNNPNERESSRNRSSGRDRRSPRRHAPWNLSRRYLAHPYALGITGFELPADVAGESRGIAVVMSLEGGMLLPSVGRAGLGMRMIFGAIEVELRGSALVEREEGAAVWAGLVGARVAYAITDGGPARVRVLAGMLSFFDAAGDASGAEAGFAMDAFPVRPLVVSAELTGGVLGRAGMVSARLTAGVIFDRTELFAGWTHQVLFPTVEGPVVDLGGPLLGLRFWM